MVPPVAPGASVVLGPLRFRPPAPQTAGLGNGTFVLGARIVQPFDVAPAGGGSAAVRASNNVALRTIKSAEELDLRPVRGQDDDGKDESHDGLRKSGRNLTIMSRL